RNESDIALLRAVPESSKSILGSLPFIVSQGGYVSSLTLVNPTDETQMLRIVAEALQIDSRNPFSAPSLSVQRVLPPHARLEERADRMFGFTGDALVTASMHYEVESATGGVIGVLNYAAADGKLLTSVEAQEEAASSLLFSHNPRGIGS